MGVRSRLAGILRFFTEARSTTAPNATIPAHSFTPKGDEASIDTVLATKYQGSLMTAVPDGTAQGGNKRGIAAVDWQLSRVSAADVASGQSSTIGGGFANRASGQDSTVAGGTQNVASGEAATVAGGSVNQATAQSATVGGGDSNVASGYGATVPGGSENTASGYYSTAIGTGATARHQAELAHSNGGTAQGGFIVAGVQTTNATPTQLTLDGAAKIVPVNDEVWGFRVRVVGRCTAASKAFVTDLEFAVTNFGGTLTQLGSTEVGFSRATGSTTWTAVVYVSGDDVSVTVTGAVGETVDWSADFWYGRVG